MAHFSIQRQVLGLIAWTVVCFAASAIGALASIQAQAFYGQLAQPAWAPPPGVFGPVWTVLYFLMAVAAWWVWRRGGFRANQGALTLFLVQLAFNALWSWLFFAWRLSLWALLDIVVLWALILATVVFFWRVRAMAGALLIPYLLWVTFAGALNFSLWRLNPEILA